MQRFTMVAIGRTSGMPREVTLYGFEDGGGLVIVGSNGGKPADPAWVANVRANPAVSVRTGRRERPMRAHEVHGDERARCWEVAVAGFPLYRTYAARTDRPIPVFVLEPVAGDGAEGGP